jgi:hypothetical protein
MPTVLKSGVSRKTRLSFEVKIWYHNFDTIELTITGLFRLYIIITIIIIYYTSLNVVSHVQLRIHCLEHSAWQAVERASRRVRARTFLSISPSILRIF